MKTQPRESSPTLGWCLRPIVLNVHSSGKYTMSQINSGQRETRQWLRLRPLSPHKHPLFGWSNETGHPRLSLTLLPDVTGSGFSFGVSREKL
jgi:hypothetical protein